MKKFKYNEYQAKFLEMLESGKYNQTKGRCIRYKNKKYSYCALGIANLASECKRRRNEFNAYFVGEKSTDMTVFGACEAAVKKLNLFNDGGGTRDGEDGIIALNDYKKKTFKEIAAIIRQKPERFFGKNAIDKQPQSVAS